MDEIRAIRGVVDRQFTAIWDAWKANDPLPFDDAYREEGLNAMAVIYRAGIKCQPGNFNSLLNPHSLMLSSIVRAIEGGRSIGRVPGPRSMEYLQSHCTLSIPFIHIMASVYADARCRAVNGESQFLNFGFANDTQFVSHLMPYCDAMLIDRKMRSMLVKEPLRSRIEFRARLFSMSVFDEFIAYLDEIEAEVPLEQRTAADEVYGLEAIP